MKTARELYLEGVKKIRMPGWKGMLILERTPGGLRAKPADQNGMIIRGQISDENEHLDEPIWIEVEEEEEEEVVEKPKKQRLKRGLPRK